MRDRSRINTHVRPLLGNRVARNLSVADLEHFQAEVAAGRTAKPRSGRGGVTTGGAGVAGRTLGMLHTIFEQAARHKLIENNPARGVRKAVTDVKLERRLSLAEIGRLGMAMNEAVEESPVALSAVRFMLLTGFRRMEVLALERTWIDAGSFCIRFPKTKGGAQIRAIGDAALALLQRQPVSPGSRYAFPSEVGDGHFVGVVRVLQRLCAAADLDDVTPHVLRHTFASVAGDLGFSELTIAGLLGHAGRGATQRYVHLDRALVLAAHKAAEEIQRSLEAHRPRRPASLRDQHLDLLQLRDDLSRRMSPLRIEPSSIRQGHVIGRRFSGVDQSNSSDGWGGKFIKITLYGSSCAKIAHERSPSLPFPFAIRRPVASRGALFHKLSPARDYYVSAAIRASRHVLRYKSSPSPRALTWPHGRSRRGDDPFQLSPISSTTPSFEHR